MINCKYPKIKGGVVAIIEEDRKLLISEKFKKLNDAVNWTNAWVSGYTSKKLKIKDVQRLKDEGFITFQNKDDIETYLENNMKHKVITKDGKPKSFESCLGEIGKTWFKIKNLKAREGFGDSESEEFFKKYNIRRNWFNLICLREIGMVFLDKKEYNSLGDNNGN